MESVAASKAETEVEQGEDKLSGRDKVEIGHRSAENPEFASDPPGGAGRGVGALHRLRYDVSPAAQQRGGPTLFGPRATWIPAEPGRAGGGTAAPSRSRPRPRLPGQLGPHLGLVLLGSLPCSAAKVWCSQYIGCAVVVWCVTGRRSCPV